MGPTCRRALLPDARARRSTWAPRSNAFPIHVKIHDIVAEGDRVVVRNTWTGTDRASGRKFQFSGIVIWRIANRQLAERWASLEAPKQVS
jgi:predicted ester cyclase